MTTSEELAARVREDVDRNGDLIRKREDARRAQNVPRVLRSTEEIRSRKGATKPLVYIAGPYTKPDPVENIHRAIKLADSLLDVCVPVIPHLTGFWHVVSPKPYEVWLELDLEYMRRCDIVYRYEGASSGADGEVDEAERVGIPVVHSEDELREWIAEWA